MSIQLSLLILHFWIMYVTAPRVWYSCFTTHIMALGFVDAGSDTSIYLSAWF
jgi:hypothetical protein